MEFLFSSTFVTLLAIWITRQLFHPVCGMDRMDHKHCSLGVNVRGVVMVHLWEQPGVSFLGAAQVFLIFKLCIFVLLQDTKSSSTLAVETAIMKTLLLCLGNEPWKIRGKGCSSFLVPFKSNLSWSKTSGGIRLHSYVLCYFYKAT